MEQISPPAPGSTAPWVAVLWSLVCPGLGEYKVGHRRLGLAILLAVLVAAIWLFVAGYQSVYGLSDLVKGKDPSLAAQPESPGDAVVLVSRLFGAILREYNANRDLIHKPMAGPIWTILVLYLYSMGQAFVLARRARPPAGADTERSCHVS
ncbi:MAG: hypothetical protein HY815_20285 [Candidatus Riflebacteria bacterium]|nr:hypothetical protein [Candidatus Riflebacteria bacterium]